MHCARRSVGGASLCIPVKQDRDERGGKADDKSGFHACLSTMAFEALHRQKPLFPVRCGPQGKSNQKAMFPVPIPPGNRAVRPC